MAHPIKSPRKLIEVALPLDAINEAAAREKSIRHGHPSTLHLWWARRPLAAARAVIFAQLVNDPGSNRGRGFNYGMNKAAAAAERKRLFKIIEELVQWENTGNEQVLDRARAEIRRSWREVCELNKDHPQAAELFNPDQLPAFHDPFAGGGAIPLEAQRLGLESFASDLNPVAVLLNKSMVEIPPLFSDRAPVNRRASKARGMSTWSGATGLADDLRHYGKWIREEAEKRVGAFYPPVEITPAMARERPDLEPFAGKSLPVIAWLWARTVRSPNPAFSRVDVPLAATFVLSSKETNPVFVDPVITGDGYQFRVRLNDPPASAELGSKADVRGANFRCVMSGSPISPEYIRSEAQAGRMGERLMAIVVDAGRSRVYLSPTEEAERTAKSAVAAWRPDVEFFQQALGFRVGNYGMRKWSDLFTSRQLLTLSTLAELVVEARAKVLADALQAGLKNDGVPLSKGGSGAQAYAEAVSVYLGLAASKSAMFINTLSRWRAGEGKTAPAFGRQAIAMVWDFADINPFAGAGGDFEGVVDGGARALTGFHSKGRGKAVQMDAQTQTLSKNKVVSTDPPYYDNIGYADLSDFFYVWLRYSLRSVFPDLFSTISVPKEEELVATPARHGGREQAEKFFLDGMSRAMRAVATQAHPEVPITIYYAFKQSETDAGASTSSTGWETFLEAVCRAGMQVCGTWPMRTENATRMRGMDANALASSIVLVCRGRPLDATTVSRREFIRELNSVLPEALDEMTRGADESRSPVAPVDLSQAIIGPGMAVYSKYAAVLEADGTPMSVKSALQLINRFFAEDEFDGDTQFCLHWFEQHGWSEGIYGEADVLARAKSTSVRGLEEAGVIVGGQGKVRLLRSSEYPSDWDPRKDTRIPVWEALHQLIRSFRQDGESGAGKLLVHVKDRSEAIRQLAYRLYTLCERQGWAEDARAYNELVAAWTAIDSVAEAAPAPAPQLKLFGGT